MEKVSNRFPFIWRTSDSRINIFQSFFQSKIFSKTMGVFHAISKSRALTVIYALFSSFFKISNVTFWNLENFENFENLKKLDLEFWENKHLKFSKIFKFNIFGFSSNKPPLVSQQLKTRGGLLLGM